MKRKDWRSYPILSPLRYFEQGRLSSKDISPANPPIQDTHQPNIQLKSSKLPHSQNSPHDAHSTHSLTRSLTQVTKNQENLPVDCRKKALNPLNLLIPPVKTICNCQCDQDSPSAEKKEANQRSQEAPVRPLDFQKGESENMMTRPREHEQSAARGGGTNEIGKFAVRFG